MQYVGIQTQQSRNNRRSVLLLFLFPCLVAALLYLACYLLAAMGHGESMEVSILELANPLFINALPYTMGVVLIWFLIAFWANTSIIKAATPAPTPPKRGIPSFPKISTAERTNVSTIWSRTSAWQTE